ncbi:hypothetical protein BH11PAT2_BH11PAT2_08870 [soil metagenome]
MEDSIQLSTGKVLHEPKTPAERAALEETYYTESDPKPGSGFALSFAIIVFLALIVWAIWHFN